MNKKNRPPELRFRATEDLQRRVRRLAKKNGATVTRYLEELVTIAVSVVEEAEKEG